MKEEENKSKFYGESDQPVRNGLVIKLKLPTKCEIDEDEEEFDHICKICNKGFRSGKALGGHMRIHNQSDNELDRPKMKNHNASEPICSICKRKFPSMKSLFGHMRCHPERDWRGIQPPSSSSSESNCANNLNLSRLKWLVTDKRGRKMRKKSTNRTDSDSESKSRTDDEKMHEAVYDLMMLSSGNPLDFSGNSPSNSTTMNDYVITTSNPKAEFRYKCTTCDKSFATHQALGGHRASHNKSRNETLMNEKVDGIRVSLSPHQCKICGKNFPTGQALGGHQRCHYINPNEGRSTGEIGCKKVWFDLNELPNLEDEEGELVALKGNGACSSYNIVGSQMSIA